MGKSQRVKGNSFERRVANDLKDLFPDAKRGIQFRNSQDGNPDVIVPYFYIECKAHKVAPVRSALQQAIDNNNDQEKYPLAVLKDDYKEPFVVMLYDDFLDFIKKTIPLLQQSQQTQQPESNKE